MKTDIDWIVNSETLTIKVQPRQLKVSTTGNIIKIERACMIAIENHAEDMKVEIQARFRTLREEGIGAELDELANIFNPNE